MNHKLPNFHDSSVCGEQDKHCGTIKKDIEIKIENADPEWHNPLRIISLLKFRKCKKDTKLKKNFEVPLTQTSAYDFEIFKKMPMLTTTPQSSEIIRRLILCAAHY